MKIDKPAFARDGATIQTSDTEGVIVSTQDGITRRELFAVMAMQGLLSNPEMDQSKPKLLLTAAVGIADALCEELDGKP